MAAILAQNPLVAFRLLCGKVSRDSPLNMAKIGIASANRDQSPIRSRSSHWRNSPLKPMLSATWKLAMTHRSICLPDFPAVSQPAGSPSWTDKGEKQIGRARRVPIEAGSVAFRGSLWPAVSDR